jgi:hypothetical protein
VAEFLVVETRAGNETTMKMDLWYESYIDLNQPQHNAALRNLINVLMKSVGEHGEFRIELGGALHYGTYTVTKPGEMVEVRVTPLKKRLRKSLNLSAPARYTSHETPSQ